MIILSMERNLVGKNQHMNTYGFSQLLPKPSRCSWNWRRKNIKQDVPRRGLHFWCVPGPCCPARCVWVRACWRRTGPGCTGGPAASLGPSRAPASGPWPSALSWCAWSGPSLPMGMLSTVVGTRADTYTHKHTEASTHREENFRQINPPAKVLPVGQDKHCLEQVLAPY